MGRTEITTGLPLGSNKITITRTRSMSRNKGARDPALYMKFCHLTSRSEWNIFIENLKILIYFNKLNL